MFQPFEMLFRYHFSEFLHELDGKKKDMLLMREMAAQGIFQFKIGNKERGNTWKSIAIHLNGNKDL